MKYDELKRYLYLGIFADVFLEFISLKSDSLAGKLIFGIALGILGLAILFIDYLIYRKSSNMKNISLLTLILYTAALILLYGLGFAVGFADYSFYSAHEKIFMFIFYLTIILLALFIIFKKVYDLRVNKLEKKNKKPILYIILGIVEMAMVFSFYKQESCRMGTLRITEIENPTCITVTEYQNENQKVVNGLGEMNRSQEAVNGLLYNRTRRITDKEKIDEIISIITNKSCSALEGMKESKLYSTDFNSPSFEIYTENTRKHDENKIYFYGIKILGDTNVIFITDDKLDSSGKAYGKESYMKEYIVDLTDEEKDKLINLVTE